MTGSRIDEWVRRLAYYVAPEGFVDRVRQGIFDPADGDRFLDELRHIDLGDAKVVDRRLMASLWPVPYVLEVSRWRIERSRGDLLRYDEFASHVFAEVCRILSDPRNGKDPGSP